MHKTHPWRNDPICRIDVTGFLSIMVLFLAMFLAPVYSFPDMPTNTVDLPHASHLVFLRDVAREDAIHVYVQRDGRVYFNSMQISGDELPDKIHQALKHGSRPTVFISVDRRAKYAALASALNGIHSAGISHIAIVATSR